LSRTTFAHGPQAACLDGAHKAETLEWRTNLQKRPVAENPPGQPGLSEFKQPGA